MLIKKYEGSAEIWNFINQNREELKTIRIYVDDTPQDEMLNDILVDSSEDFFYQKKEQEEGYYVWGQKEYESRQQRDEVLMYEIISSAINERSEVLSLDLKQEQASYAKKKYAISISCFAMCLLFCYINFTSAFSGFFKMIQFMLLFFLSFFLFVAGCETLNSNYGDFKRKILEYRYRWQALGSEVQEWTNRSSK